MFKHLELGLTDPQLEKASGRTSTLLSATIRWEGGENAAFVRNISEMGALIECDTPLIPNTPITLEREGMEVSGFIVWAKDQVFGIKFSTALEPAIWLGEKSLDKAAKSLTTAKGLLDDESDVSSLIDHRLSEEIAYASRMIEVISNILSNDVILCNRYPTQLQSLSIAVQMLSEISLVVNAKDKLQEVNNKVTGPMKNRLLR